MLQIRPPIPDNAEFSLGTEWHTDSGYTLHFTKSGNLELKNRFGATLWESGTIDRSAGKLVMQADGNLVIYDESAATAIWATNTNDHYGAFIALQDDGTFAIHSEANKPLWTTNTGGK